VKSLALDFPSEKLRFVRGVSMHLACIFLPVFLLAFGFFLVAAPTAVSGRPGASYTYYGYVPSDIWRNMTQPPPAPPQTYYINPDTVMTSGTVLVLGCHDETEVAVYRLPGERLVKQATINKLERTSVELPNGTFFKVTSSKPATVMLLGGGWQAAGAQAGISTFFPTVDGGFVGKEFVFLALEPSVTYGRELPHSIFALEDSDVTIYNRDGSAAKQYRVKVNEAQWFSLKNDTVYRIVSSGNIMVETFTIGEYRGKPLAFPAVEGGFVGKRFYGAGHSMEYMGTEQLSRGFVLSSMKDAKVLIVDLETSKKYGDKDVTITAGTNLSMHVKAFHMGLDSDQPVMMVFKNTNYDGGGVIFTGLKAGQEAVIYLAQGKAYLFSAKDAVVTVDDVTQRIAADEPLQLWPGTHKVSATENVLVEMVVLIPYVPPPGQVFPELEGLGTFGGVIPSIESLSATNENLGLKPLIQQELPWTYIAAAVVPIALIIIWLAIRRGRRAAQP